MHEIDQTDAVIATRYHNVICALARGRPVIAIGYSIKFNALMQDFDLSGYTQHVDSIDVKQLQVQFQALTVDHAALVDRVQRRSLQMRMPADGFLRCNVRRKGRARQLVPLDALASGTFDPDRRVPISQA